MLFSRYKVAYEKKRKIMRNVASIAELKKSFFAEIDKVENREELEKMRLTNEGRIPLTTPVVPPKTKQWYPADEARLWRQRASRRRPFR